MLISEHPVFRYILSINHTRNYTSKKWSNLVFILKALLVNALDKIMTLSQEKTIEQNAVQYRYIKAGQF